MLNKAFLGKISAFIDSRQLLNREDKCIVALSGGADSVALALVLKELGYTVEAAHCNFHLRGEESDRDENFCRKFCSDNSIVLHVTHFDTKGFAKLRKMSIEMAARHLRYSYFDGLKNDIGAAAVCVAHHRDDSVETVLMNLMRGTGIHGLVGIKPRNGYIIRPLLCVSRSEIEAALSDVGQDFVTDSTNLVDDVVRNKIRLDILPMMKNVNPSVCDSIAKTAERLGMAAEMLDRITSTMVNGIVERRNDGTLDIVIDKLKSTPSPEYILFEILKDYSFAPAQVELIGKVMASAPGRVFVSSTHQLLIDRGKMVIEPLARHEMPRLQIPETGTYVYSDAVKFSFERMECGAGFKLERSPACCYADMSRLVFPLTIRPVVAGDRFIPFGMTGSKLVSDYLTDRKVNLFDKRRQLVVADGEGRIVWLVNQRPDNRFRITPNTKAALKVTCITCDDAR